MSGRFRFVAAGFALLVLPARSVRSQPLRLGPTGGVISAIAVDPRNSKIVFAIDQDTSELYRSTDSGGSWAVSLAFEPVDRSRTSQVVIDPFDDRFATVDLGSVQYRSTDGGATWSLVPRAFSPCIPPPGWPCDPVGPGNVIAFGVAPSRQSDIFEMTSDLAFQRTDDGGLTWHAVGGPDMAFGEQMREIRVDPFDESNVFVLIEFPTGLGGPDFFETFRSTDGGKSFGATPSPIFAMAFDLENPGVIYGAAGPRLVRSTDHGQTWLRISGPGVAFSSLAVRRGELFGWDLAGSTIWSASLADLVWGAIAVPAGGIGDVAVAPEPNDAIYVANSGNALLTPPSPIGGQSPAGIYKMGSGEAARWDWSSAGIVSGRTRVLAADPIFVSRLYAEVDGESPQRLLESDDGGATWRRCFLADGSIYAMAIDRRNIGRQFLATSQGVFRSANGAQSWQPTALAADTRAVAIDAAGQWIYAATEAGLEQSSDYGESWTASGLPYTAVLAVVTDPSRPEALYAAARLDALETAIFWSTDSGRTWIEGFSDPGQFLSLSAGPGDLANVVASFSDGSWWSEDGGRSWYQVGFFGDVSIFVADPAHTGVFFEYDGAQIWRWAYGVRLDDFGVDGSIRVVGSIAISGDGSVIWLSIPGYGIESIAVPPFPSPFRGIGQDLISRVTGRFVPVHGRR